MNLQQEISSNYSSEEKKEAKAQIVFNHNLELRVEINRHQGFIDSADKELELIEEGKVDFKPSQRDFLLSVIDYRNNEIDKLKKQLYND